MRRHAGHSLAAMPEPVEAPRPASRGGEVEENKAIENRDFTFIHHRVEIMGGVDHEVGDGHFARKEESRDSGKETDGQKETANQL